MTRKRFIKLAMSYGVQRNDAESMAAMVGWYGSYTNLMAAYSMRFAVTKPLNAIKRTARNIIKQFALYFESISN